MSSRRRNGKPASCEPCRHDKVRCDHRLPVCTRCRDRRISNQCFYHPAPLTRQRASLPSPLTETSHGASRLSETLHSPPSSELDSYQSPETTFPFHMGYVGPTSFVAEFITDNELAGDHCNDATNQDEISRHLPPYWFSRISDILTLLEDFPLLERLIREFYDVTQTALIPGPFIRNAIGPIRKLSEQHRLERRTGQRAAKLCSRIVENTAKAFHVPFSTQGSEFHTLFTGENTRLEILGIMFALAGRSTRFGLGSGAFVIHGEPQKRAEFAQKMLLASDITLRICKMLTPINDLLVWLVYENMLLSCFVHGDSSEAIWTRLGDLSTNIFALGAHREIKPSSGVPPFMIQLRKRLFSASYQLDKNVATSLGRPPRVSSRHSDCRIPLCIKDELFGATSEVFERGCEAVDENGWSPQPIFQPSAWIRLRYVNATFREEILEMSVRTLSPDAVEQLNDISRRCNESWQSNPAHLRFTPNSWDDNLSFAINMMRIIAYLAYLYNDLLIQGLLARQSQVCNGAALLSVSSHILSTVLFLGAHRQHTHQIHRDLTWTTLIYGFPAAGVLIKALQSEARHGTEFNYTGSRSELIRNLSVFISHLDTLERPGHGNHALFSRASKAFSAIIDEILEPRLSVSNNRGNYAAVKHSGDESISATWNENDDALNFINNGAFLDNVDFGMAFDQWLV
ncbi:hypothetical protein BGW36DRAFT_76206 [Talaromyces proteolyticus]|uniref:Zn(2)-C6 fungal-type domain-containing protein n=1 Tax=Talaromyces proteolyticus TaxID=1131652 RepID=A0AAD4PSI4_9EURO|nr:uncharacterized protein BGW36DRAFT_76206 [Talaromyces proteolyticus]KAH8689026.1 hypothetical protein BGW36DRAFT_76206 [Talaromyces proteolyticus]